MSRFWKNFFASPVFEEEERTRQAFFLNVIAWALFLVPPVYFLYVAAMIPADFSRALAQAAAAESVTLFILLLTRARQIRAATLVLVGGLWLFFTASAVTGAGVRGESYLLGYPLAIMIAGILKNRRVAIGVTVLSLLTGLGMAYAETRGLFTPAHVSAPLVTWIISLVIFPLTMILQTLAARVIHDALRRARESEERYKLISGVISDYTFAADVGKDGSLNLVWTAGAFEKITGYTLEEYVAAGGWRARLHPDDVEKDAQDMEKLRRGESVVNSEIRTFSKNGETRWNRIFAHPVWDERENRLARIVGAAQDISAQKKSEEILKETLLRQTAILNGIPDMAWMKDKEGRYIAVNEQFIRAAGKPPEEIVGKTDFEIWEKEFANAYRRDDLDVTLNAKPKRIEELQQEASGRQYWVETFKTPIVNEAGEVTGTVGIAREITERKKAEMEREALIRELETKNAELERYTYTVSHDLKSPLVTIRGFLGYLEKEILAGDMEKAKKDIRRIEEATKKMQALLNDLLELSRIGRLMNQPAEALFTDIAREAVELLQGQIELHKACIEIIDSPVKVIGDRVRLTEVVQNLVDNAVKFMGDQPSPKVTIGVQENEGGETVFFVRDNGMGIEP
ncbi:MAG: PAS domain S-box protein, partial [Chloroflexi bacterium]|nr:PAS domain S-box protein [Chloroflexota bacterium]